MNDNHNTVKITIDGNLFTARKGSSILQAAQQNNIYIPTLCYHKDLSPYGGCRMCLVEIEGVRGFPTSCTTPVEEGMLIRTNTSQLQTLRKEILQLFLSEHTSSCLICDEQVECKQYMPTIRKAGITTGCRYCPKDGQCELQAITEYLGIKDINYPIAYRSLRVETEDPFYDRDYNLCILCGRCVRMCQEIRTANVLAFKYHGRGTVIGPAFGRTHLEAGCEFCGACVAVCPTGSLREKARAWEGKPDREVTSTCSFCGVGCQVKILVKGDRVIGSLPAEDALVNEGQLCVKGRFCNTELVNGYQRLRNPYHYYLNSQAEISWNKAAELAAEKLSKCSPNQFGMVVSPNCTTEDLYIAQKFTRAVMNSNNIDTSARWFYGGGFNSYLNLFKKNVSLSALQKASVILCVGLDTRYGRSVVGVALRKAVKRGAKIISINPRNHNFSLIANQWLQPEYGENAETLNLLLHLITNGKARKGLPSELLNAAQLLKDSTNTVILIGSEFLQHTNCKEVVEAIENLAQNIGAGVMPLPAQNNFLGSVLAGAYSELLPGSVSSSSEENIKTLQQSWAVSSPDFSSKWNSGALSPEQKLNVLYLVGELPPMEQPLADYTIFQNIYPPEPYCHADLILPSAASTEVDGTFINGEGRIQQVHKAVNPPVNALPDWKILCLIAKKMGASGFDYESVDEIQKEISALVPDFKIDGEYYRKPHQFKEIGAVVSPKHKENKANTKSDHFPFLLSVSVVEHTHRGFPLAFWVEGSKMLLTEGMLEIHPEDAAAIGISNGDNVEITSSTINRIFPVKLHKEQPRGTLHISLRECSYIQPNPQSVNIRKVNV